MSVVASEQSRNVMLFQLLDTLAPSRLSTVRLSRTRRHAPAQTRSQRREALPTDRCKGEPQVILARG